MQNTGALQVAFCSAPVFDGELCLPVSDIGKPGRSSLFFGLRNFLLQNEPPAMPDDALLDHVFR